MAFDAFIWLLSIWLSFWLRLAHPFHPDFSIFGSWMIDLSLIVGPPSVCSDWPVQGLTRYVGSASFYRLAAGIFSLLSYLY